MKYESMEKAIAENKNRAIYVTRSIDPPCGPCCMGADNTVLAVYSTAEEALAEMDDIFKEHRCEDETYMQEIVKLTVDSDGQTHDEDEPIRTVPDDEYWEKHGDEFDYDWECWEEEAALHNKSEELVQMLMKNETFLSLPEDEVRYFFTDRLIEARFYPDDSEEE